MVRRRLSASRFCRGRRAGWVRPKAVTQHAPVATAPIAACWVTRYRSNPPPASAAWRRPPAPTASASATSCRCRCRSISSGGGGGGAVVRGVRAVRPAHARAPCARPVRLASRRRAAHDRPPRRSRCAQGGYARPVSRHCAGRADRRPEPLSQRRPDARLGRLVGGLCLRPGLRRRYLEPDQSLAHRLRCGRLALPASGSDGNELSLRLPYPPKLGAWPACLLLLVFAWIELISPNAASPAPHRLACHRLLRPDLGRHAGVRARRVAWPRRGVLAGVRHARPLRAHRGEGRRARPAPVRRGPAGRRASVDLDDGVRAAPARNRALRRADRHRRMGAAGRGADPNAGRPGRGVVDGDQERGPPRPVAAVPRRLPRGQRRHERAGRRPSRHARSCAQLRPHAGPDRHRLPRRALPRVSPGPGPVRHPAAVGPLRLRVEPARDGRVSRRHRPGGGALRLVRRRCRHRHRARRRRLSRPCQGDRPVRRRRRSAAIAAAADRADGALHVLRAVDHRPADRGEPGAARGRGKRGHQGAAGRAAAARAGWPPCGAGARQDDGQG